MANYKNMTDTDMRIRRKELELQMLQLEKKDEELNKYSSSIIKDHCEILNKLMDSDISIDSKFNVAYSKDHLDILNEFKKVNEQKKALQVLMNDAQHEMNDLDINIAYKERTESLEALYKFVSGDTPTEDEIFKIISKLRDTKES